MILSPSTACDVRSDRRWFLVAMLVVVAVACGLRYGTGILQRGPIFDERWISGPIADLIRHGWSVERAIDFQETKGPAMIWPYALFGGAFVADRDEVAGPDAPLGDRRGSRRTAWTSPHEGLPAPAPPDMMNLLRGVSTWFFVLSVIPLLWLASICGLRGPPLVYVALGLALLPYEALFSQMVMGEVSFVFFALWLVLLVALGLGRPADRSGWVLPLLACLLLAVMLHNRPHAAAFMPGICLLAFWRRGWRGWPWWLACVVAVLLRVPLWARWGGFVSSVFQTFHGLGFRLEGINYLAAAMLMPLGAFLVVWVVRCGWRARRSGWLVPAGMALGLMLGILAPPDFALPPVDLSQYQERFMGFAATLSKLVAGKEAGAVWVLPILSMLGLGSLAAFAALTIEFKGCATARAVLILEVLTMTTGWLLYAFTYGSAFDRYLLAWTIALPIAWVVLLPRWMMWVQFAALGGALGYLTWVWLI